MVSKYLKALALTFVLSVLGLAVINYYDSARLSQIASVVDEYSLASDSAQLLLLYDSIYGGDSEFVCDAISKRIDAQAVKTGDVLSRLNEVSSQGFFADSKGLKEKYLNSSVLLYLLVEKSRKDCADSDVVPVVYFYSENAFVAEEEAQAKILDSVVEKCPNVRVFAFPRDFDIPVVDVLIAKYGIEVYPSLIADGVKVEGIANEERILALTHCTPR